MTTTNRLSEAFEQVSYPLAGNRQRNLQVLKDVLDRLDGNIDSDMYGNGKIIEDFQTKMANFLGKESAVFFPSGTMAQQIALRIWCDRKGLKKVAYHPLSHLEIHEEGGLKELHHIESVLLADTTRTIVLEDVLEMKDDVACLLLELPQREIGGQLPDYQDLVAISKFCREKGIHLHLDGARLFEIQPYYGKSATEICELFDSVYVSFYKGIGGVAGAILAGEESFTKESKVWKRRHGGDLISLYPYILSADYYFDQRINNMELYFEGAKELAARFNECHSTKTVPVQPISNMFHVHFQVSKEKLEPILVDIYKATNVGITHYLRETGESGCFFELSVGDRYTQVPKDQLAVAMSLLNDRLKDIESL